MKKFKELDCILLVDDDKLCNFVHSKAVEKAGIGASVKDITNVEEALEFLTYTGRYENTQHLPRPGIIFLDINMPGLNGWDFMTRYKELDAKYKAKVVIVMLTTSLNPDDRERAMQDEEIMDFLPKPLRHDMVIEVANKYFQSA